MNDEVSDRLAREFLARQLANHCPGGGPVIEIVEHADSIAETLEAGEQINTEDIAATRSALRRLEDRLDDVCALHEIPRWETGVRWGELSNSEQKAVQEWRKSE